MICIYSKKCLTKLATVSAVDRVKLIKETIVDMFIRNPISGCFDFPKPNWSMLLIFKKMIVEHDMSVIKMI